MSVAVAILPTTRAVEAAWDRYAALWRAWDADGALRGDRAHNEAMVAAWAEWRDLFLSWNGRC